MSPRLDLPTVLLFYNTSLLAGAVAILHVRRHSTHPSGLAYLATAYGLLALGAMLAWQGEGATIPTAIWTHGSLFLGYLGYACFWAGILGLSSRSPQGWWWVPALPAAGLLLGVVTGFPLHNLQRAGAFHAVAIVTLAASTIHVLRNYSAERLPSARALAFFLALSGSIYTLKLILILNGTASPGSFAMAFFLQMFCHFGIALMVVTISKERAKIQLTLLADTDPLTSVGNRRWLTARLPDALTANSAVLQLDIDHFKQINDRFGHATGDAVLVSFAGCLKQQLRENDLLARTGGEEFVVYAPVISQANAAALAERLRECVQHMAIEKNGVPIPVTTSIGVAWVGQGSVAIQECLSKADEALYDAKRGGRNRVVLAAAESVAQ